MLPVGFETTIPAGERPKTYALDSASTGTGNSYCLQSKLFGDVTHLFPAGPPVPYFGQHLSSKQK